MSAAGPRGTSLIQHGTPTWPSLRFPDCAHVRYTLGITGFRCWKAILRLVPVVRQRPRPRAARSYWQDRVASFLESVACQYNLNFGTSKSIPATREQPVRFTGCESVAAPEKFHRFMQERRSAVRLPSTCVFSGVKSILSLMPPLNSLHAAGQLILRNLAYSAHPQFSH